MNYATIDKNNIDDFIKSNIVIVAKLRSSRIKCKGLAVLELLSLLESFKPLFITNGPLGDIKGCITVSLSLEKYVEKDVLELLSHAGYTYSFYYIDFENTKIKNDLYSVNPYVWKGKKFSVIKLFEEDVNVFREQAPDKREFKLLCEDGVVRSVIGYRGDGSEMGRRALPVEDCRLLVNLSIKDNTKNFLDPFCGAGGIVYQVRLRNNVKKIFSVDIAKELARGLEDYGAIHFTCKASDFISKELIDAVSTEVPFSLSATKDIVEGFSNLKKYLTSNCIISIMCKVNQKEDIENALIKIGYFIGASIPVNRKGTDVQVIICFILERDALDFRNLWDKLKHTR